MSEMCSSTECNESCHTHEQGMYLYKMLCVMSHIQMRHAPTWNATCYFTRQMRHASLGNAYIMSHI